MNRALLARTHRKFYESYIAELRAGGAPKEQIDEQVEDSIEEAKCLLAGTCPECGKPIARYVDREKQQGPSEMPGVWVQYRCSTSPPPGEQGPRPCGFMVDFKEGDEAN